eukprot:1138840-Pelagomonas_calceolata.AAC.6
MNLKDFPSATCHGPQPFHQTSSRPEKSTHRLTIGEGSIISNPCNTSCPWLSKSTSRLPCKCFSSSNQASWRGAVQLPMKRQQELLSVIQGLSLPIPFSMLSIEGHCDYTKHALPSCFEIGLGSSPAASLIITIGPPKPTLGHLLPTDAD